MTSEADGSGQRAGGGIIGRLALSGACCVLLGRCLCAPALSAPAQPNDKFHITAQEKAACSSDAIRFCMHTYPDEDQLLACMKQNRDALTTTCRVAFDAGVKRRRL